MDPACAGMRGEEPEQTHTSSSESSTPFPQGKTLAVQDASLTLYPGEVVAIVGESGSGKSTLLNCIAGRLTPTQGEVSYLAADGQQVNVHTLSERQRRQLERTEWGFVQQHASDGLRMNVSAGANIGERLMGQGQRHCGHFAAPPPLDCPRDSTPRIDDSPRAFSGGCANACRARTSSPPGLVLWRSPRRALRLGAGQAARLSSVALMPCLHSRPPTRVARCRHRTH